MKKHRDQIDLFRKRARELTLPFGELAERVGDLAERASDEMKARVGEEPLARLCDGASDVQARSREALNRLRVTAAERGAGQVRSATGEAATRVADAGRDLREAAVEQTGRLRNPWAQVGTVRVGIDLGTTFSCVAYVGDDARPRRSRAPTATRRLPP